MVWRLWKQLPLSLFTCSKWPNRTTTWTLVIANDDRDQEQRRGRGDDGDDDDDNYNDASDCCSPNHCHVLAELCDYPWGKPRMVLLMPSTCVCVHVQLCLTLFDPMDHSPPGSSAYGIFQARILEQFAISFSRRLSWPRDQTHVSHVCCVHRWVLYQMSHRGSLPPTSET